MERRFRDRSWPLRCERDRGIARRSGPAVPAEDLIGSVNIRCRWQNHVETGECRFDCFDPVLRDSPILIFKPPGALGYRRHQEPGISSPQPLSKSTVASVARSNSDLRVRSNVWPQGPAHVKTVSAGFPRLREHPAPAAAVSNDRRDRDGNGKVPQNIVKAIIRSIGEWPSQIFKNCFRLCYQTLTRNFATAVFAAYTTIKLVRSSNSTKLDTFSFFVLALSAAAQTTSVTGIIQGTVTDTTGASVPAARIAVRHQDTGVERTTQTAANGHFAVTNLAPGTYTLTLESPGFVPIRVKPFPLAAGHVVAQDFNLTPAGINERVEVKEEPEAIDLTASSASVSLGYERIEEAPARSRNYLNFVLAAPGVAPSAGASSQRTMTGTRTPLGDSGFTFGGMRPRNNAIQIDGLDNRDETTGGNRVAVGLEMVQEFRVAGTSVGAELGGAAGGLLNMITRSGVNILHGDFTMFAQNEIMNARRTEVAADRPRFRRYQPGMSANGPLRRDRTFLAGAVEHENESAEEWSNVPQIKGTTRRPVPDRHARHRSLAQTQSPSRPPRHPQYAVRLLERPCPQ